MTQATHTPGPWAYDSERNAIVSLTSWLVEPNESDGEAGIRTSVISTFGAMGGDDSAADARLIAAAPAMLAALQKINAICAPGESDPERMAAMLSEIAAIAAATGTPTGEGGHPIPVVQQGEGGQ